MSARGEQHHDSNGGTYVSMLRAGLLLALFAAATTAAVAVTREITEQRIEQNKRMQQRAIIDQLLPPDLIDNDILADTQPIPSGGALANELQHPAHFGRRNGELIAVLLPVTAPDAYSGRVRLLVAIRPDGKLRGVRVLEHRETPGLGDKVELRKSDWILGFDGKSLQNPLPEKWKVRRDGGDFDQFTGATITPRAVVAAVRRALEYFATHRDTLLSQQDHDNASGDRS